MCYFKFCEPFLQEETVLQTVPKLLGGQVVQTAYGPTFTIVDEDHVDSQRVREDIEDFIFEVRWYTRQRMANRKIGEAKKVTKFELNPANLSGFWREIWIQPYLDGFLKLWEYSEL